MSDEPRLVLAARHDPLVPHLHAALARRFPVAAEVDVELRGWRRAGIGALTFHPDRTTWGDRYMKSNLGFRARSRLAARGIDAAGAHDLVVQTHTLFSSRRPRTFVYVDCTYRQAEAGWPAWTPLTGRARQRWLAAEERTLRGAAHVFAFTDATEVSLVADYGVDPARVTVVGAGVNFEQLPAVAPPVRKSVPTVLFVGKDFERKGGHVLLDAFERVRAVVPAARLQIVGTTLPVRTPTNVDVLGRIEDRGRMDALYAQASVFCLPSLFDPGPLVVLEAMGHNLPCVLSQDAAHHVRQATAGTGSWLADTGDPVGLADGLIALLTDPDRAARMGVAAGHAVRAGFLWPHVVDRMAPALLADHRQPDPDNDTDTVSGRESG